MNNPLKEIVSAQHLGIHRGICSVCSANRFVLEASVLQAKRDGTNLLVEATSNQVNQYGGYTGMTPFKFKSYVEEIALKLGFPLTSLILGGDHLGPHPWQEKRAESAMEEADQLIRAYVSAGFHKIHLDTSMFCADDPGERERALEDEIVAERSARLCQVAEEAYASVPLGQGPPVYVIGTEVPIPGGAQQHHDHLEPTSPEAARRTIAVTHEAFQKRGLQEAWRRVVAVVVQPGVEFGDDQIFEYSSARAQPLRQIIEKYPGLVFEAHSTDYQTREHLRRMVADHFAILKVGPALTFALREALFALAIIEQELLPARKGVEPSKLLEVVEKVMRKNPKHWEKHYQGDEESLRIARRYSFSDRVRYYWPDAEVSAAVSRLIENLSREPVPPNLLSQFLPVQYRAFREGAIDGSPVSLVRHRITEVLEDYSYACGVSHH